MWKLVVVALGLAATTSCGTPSDVVETGDLETVVPTVNTVTTTVGPTTAPPTTVESVGPDPAQVFDPVPSDPDALRNPSTWLAIIDADVEYLTIYRTARARDVAPDDAELRIDRYIGGGLVTAEDLRGPEVGFGWQDVDLIVSSSRDEDPFTIVVGFGVDATTATLERAGFELVDEPAVYPDVPRSLPLRGPALGLDRSNEVLVGGSPDDDLLARALTRTPSSRSMADLPVVQAVLAAAGDAHAISISSSTLPTTRYPQFLGMIDTITALPNGNLDQCLLLPYRSAADAESAAAMLVDDIAAADELAPLADLEVGTSSIVMTVCQRDRADPDLSTVIFSEAFVFPPFE